MKFVVVTTEKRGVFAGTLAKGDIATGIVTLADAQMCVYWDKSVKGVVGLAVIGPQAKSRVTKAVPRLTINGVTAIMHATEEAQDAWQRCPWEE